MLPVLFLRGEPTTHTLLSHTNARFDFRTMLNTFLWDTKVLSCPTHSSQCIAWATITIAHSIHTSPLMAS